MHQHGSRFLTVMLVGFLGTLIASELRIGGAWVFLVLIVLAAVAGWIGRAWSLLPALWLGIVAMYPVALALGVFAFLGENWLFYLGFFLLVAAIGYGAGMLVGRRMDFSRTI